LTEPVAPGDLLVGWFGQFDVPGEVQVSDNVNGPWTRSVSTTWNGAGDIALLYRENSAAAPSGLVITVSASAPAYLQEAVADFRHVATVGALDQALIAQGVGTDARAGSTAPVPAGELVVAAVLTAGQPAWATPGSSQTVPFVLDVENGSASSDLEDILSSAAGHRDGGPRHDRPHEPHGHARAHHDGDHDHAADHDDADDDHHDDDADHARADDHHHHDDDHHHARADHHHHDQHDVAAAAVQRVVPGVPRQLSRGAGLHGRPSPGAVRLPVSGAPGESESCGDRPRVGAGRAGRRVRRLRPSC